MTYVNLATLLLSMFVASRGFLNFINDMILTLAGGSQFVFVTFFGGKLMDAVSVFIFTYCFFGKF